MSNLNFYAVAHQDDWQLFMNPDAAKALTTTGNKGVFIYTTAGDSGMGPDYWLQREKSALMSIYSILTQYPPNDGVIPDSTLADIYQTCFIKSTSTINNHPITCYTYQNSVCYCLRLPDGNTDGSGFPAYNNQSLLKLQNGSQTQISAVDGTTTYQGWQDLVVTLAAIIDKEVDGYAGVISTNQPNTTLNPSDHSDHYCTGQAMFDTRCSVPITYYLGYATVLYHDPNLSEADSYWKAQFFGAYDLAFRKFNGHSTMAESIYYPMYCTRQYTSS